MLNEYWDTAGLTCSTPDVQEQHRSGAAVISLARALRIANSSVLFLGHSVGGFSGLKTTPTVAKCFVKPTAGCHPD